MPLSDHVLPFPVFQNKSLFFIQLEAALSISAFDLHLNSSDVRQFYFLLNASFLQLSNTKSSDFVPTLWE